MNWIRVISCILLYILSTQSYQIRAQSVLAEKWVPNQSDTSYQAIIDHLEKDYNLYFSYSPNILNEQSYFQTGDSKTIGRLFKEIFTKNNIDFEIVEERRILLYKSKLQKIEISGVIRDLDSKESIPAASILIKEAGKYATANDDGYFYCFIEGKDSVTIIFNSIAYSANSFVFNESQSKLIIELSSNHNSQIATITPLVDSLVNSVDPAKDEDFIKRSTSVGLSVFGLPDITQQIRNQAMVQNGNEGQSGFVVKGGSIDQNLILVDGMPVYDISHIGGLSSIFISPAIKELKLYSAGAPSEYGGKLSSVMDVKINEGNTEEFKGEATFGWTGAEGHLEGPLVRNRTAISLSGRYNDFNFLSDDYFSRLGGYNDSELNFYDFYSKLHHKFSPTNRISLTYYRGKDKLFLFSQKQINSGNEARILAEENRFQWGNELLSLQWNKLLTKKIFLASKIGFSNYNLNGDGFLSDQTSLDSSIVVGVNASSSIRNIVGSVKFDIYETSIGKLNFGANTIIHNFAPKLNESLWINEELVSSNTSNSEQSKALEFNAFVENSISFTDHLSLRGGLAMSSFSVIDTSYYLIEPRAKLIYRKNKHILDLNISINHQYVHLLSNPGPGLPSDIWIPSSKELEPSRAQDITLGYNYFLSDDLKFEIQGYFKYMQGLKENIAGPDVLQALIGNSLTVTNILTSETDWQKRIEQGRGYSTGLGGSLNYNSKKFQCILSYTFTRTKHLFPSIQQFLDVPTDTLFNGRHDRPVDLLAQVSYSITDDWTLFGKFVYGTGLSYTYPDSYFQGPPEKYFATGRNNTRLPDYHHLDINLSYTKELKNYNLYFNLGLYNVYNRNNIFYTYLNLNENNALQETGVGLLPRLPSATFKISF